jgi:hypothetical protein
MSGECRCLAGRQSGDHERRDELLHKISSTRPRALHHRGVGLLAYRLAGRTLVRRKLGQASLPRNPPEVLAVAALTRTGTASSFNPPRAHAGLPNIGASAQQGSGR